MLDFTKHCDKPSELLENEIFPMIMDLLISNMKENEEKGWRYLRRISGVQVAEEGSRI